MIEIYDHKTSGGDDRVVVLIDGSATRHETYQAAFEFLNGKVRELQSVVETAQQMYLIHTSDKSA